MKENSNSCPGKCQMDEQKGQKIIFHRLANLHSEKCSTLGSNNEGKCMFHVHQSLQIELPMLFMPQVFNIPKVEHDQPYSTLVVLFFKISLFNYVILGADWSIAL